MGSETTLTFVAIIHVIVALFMIVFVLLQDSKGGAMGALGSGGGSNTIFGASGASNFLVKITRWAAILFAATCIFLTMATTRKESSVLDTVAPEAGTTAPVEQTVPVKPAQPDGSKKK